MIVLTGAFLALAVICLVIALALSAAVAWPLLNRAGADIGRAVAWFCSGGLGWKLARVQMAKLDQAEAMARLMIDAAGWRRERARFPAGERVRALSEPGVIMAARTAPHSHGPAWYCYSYGCDQGQRRTLLARQWDRQQAWLCPACHHGNHGCTPGRCRCPSAAPRW